MAAGVAVAVAGLLVALAAVTAAALLPDDDQIGEPVDMDQLRHDVSVRCGVDERLLVDPDLWPGGATWRVAGTGRRPGVSFGGGGVFCG